MARMAIDDMVLRDPRVAHLAKLCGFPSRFEAIGRLLEVWSVCYDRVSPLLSEVLIDTAAGFEGFAKHMVEAELALRENDKVLRVSGVKQRIKYLEAKSDAGRKGGVKSGESRRNRREANTKHSFKQTEASLNPPDPVPDPVLVPVPDGAPAGDPERGAPRRSHRLPHGWRPSDSPANVEAQTTAVNRGVDLQLELTKLRDWALSKGETGKDWDARWRNWLRNARAARPANNGVQGVLDVQRERWRIAKAEEAAEEAKAGVS